MVHATDHTQLTLPVRCDSPKATDGHRCRLSGCGRYCWARTERAVSGLAGTSRPNGSGSAPGAADRWPHAPGAAAGAAERKSLSLRSARCGRRLPATADGSSLPRGSASVVSQLARTGTRVWSGRGRQIARREALGAQVATGEQRLRAREGRAWRVPLRGKPQFKPVEEGCKKPDLRSRSRSRPGSSSARPKSRGRRPAHGVSQTEG